MPRARWTGLILALALLCAAVGWWVFYRPTGTVVEIAPVRREAVFRSAVAASGEIIATRYADIGSSVMGKIVSLPVREGDRVEAGQVLARIDPAQAQSAADGARAVVSALEAESRASAEQVRAATADLEALEAAAREAEQQLRRASDLVERGLIAAAAFDSAQTSATTARAQADSARAALDRAKLAAAANELRVTQARAQLAGALDLLSKTAVIAPISGIVTQLAVREGEMVVVGVQNQPGTTLMTVSDLGQIDAEVKVAEADVLRLATGQAAGVTLEAVPGRQFAGRVVEIGTSALPAVGTTASAREFRVVIRLNELEPGLRPGLTCDAEIVTAERRDVLVVPLQSVVIRRDDTGADRTGVFLVERGRAVFTPVDTGVIGGLAMEVAGLAPDAQVVVGPYQVLRELADGVAVRVVTGAR